MAPPPAISLEDYDAIAAAVMETERGRWFLAEFARRNRAADTKAVLEALAAVEARLAERPLLQAADAAATNGAGQMAPEVAERLAAAAGLAKNLREELESSNRTGRFVTRTSAQVEEIERELARAIAALESDREPPVEPAPIEATREALDQIDAARVARVVPDKRHLAELSEDLARPIEVDEPEAATTYRSAEPELRDTGDAHRALDHRGEIALNGAPYDHRRGASSRAWTRPLLDSLSEAEKAMLFA